MINPSALNRPFLSKREGTKKKIKIEDMPIKCRNETGEQQDEKRLG